VTCPEGTYIAGSTTCALCPAGTFNPGTGQTQCTTCSGGTSTYSEGNVFSNACQGKIKIYVICRGGGMLIRFYKTLSEILLLFTLSKLKLFFKFEIHAKRINPNLYYVPEFNTSFNNIRVISWE
jgi:hypothetical protein